MATNMTAAEAAELLGVGSGATAAEIEGAFKRRARMSHPDRFTGASAAETAAAAAEFIRVSDARNLLLRLAAERGPTGPRVTEPLVYAPESNPRPLPQPSRATAVWISLLIVASFFCFLGGTLPLSPWNLLLLVPLDIFAIGFARTGRRAFLVGTLVSGAANAAVAVTIASFGSLVALEVLLAPVIALVVLGRAERMRAQRMRARRR